MEGVEKDDYDAAGREWGTKGGGRTGMGEPGWEVSVCESAPRSSLSTGQE